MKLFAFAVVVVAALCIDAAFANVKFRSCGQSTVKKIMVEGSDNKATPTLLRGKKYTIKADYIAGGQHSNLKTQFYAILNGAQVKWEGISLKDGCASISPSCPVQKGKTYTYTEEILVPADAPPMRTVVKIRQDGEKAEHLCVIFSLLIK